MPTGRVVGFYSQAVYSHSSFSISICVFEVYPDAVVDGKTLFKDSERNSW